MFVYVLNIFEYLGKSALYYNTLLYHCKRKCEEDLHCEESSFIQLKIEHSRSSQYSSSKQADECSPLFLSGE